MPTSTPGSGASHPTEQLTMGNTIIMYNRF